MFDKCKKKKNFNIIFTQKKGISLVAKRKSTEVQNWSEEAHRKGLGKS